MTLTRILAATTAYSGFGQVTPSPLQNAPAPSLIDSFCNAFNWNAGSETASEMKKPPSCSQILSDIFDNNVTTVALTTTALAATAATVGILCTPCSISLCKSTEQLLNEWVDSAPEERKEGYQHVRSIVLNFLKEPDSTKLNFCNCSLATPPPIFHDRRIYSRLETLDLSRNNLSRLPSSLDKLQHLKLLNLDANNFTEFPRIVVELQNLDYLTLACNTITDFPPTIAKLKKLEALEAHFNALKKLPPEVGELSALISLNLAHNDIESLPNTLGNLEKLSILDLQNNKIREIPSTLGQINQRASIALTHNPFTTLPAEVLNHRGLLLRGPDPSLQPRLPGLNFAKRASLGLPN